MKKLIQKILAVLNLVTGEANRFLQEHVQPVVDFMKVIKLAVDSPVAEGITSLTPTKLDDLAVIQLRRWLGLAIPILELPLACSNSQNMNELVECYVNYLRTVSPQMRNAIIAKTATIMTQLRSRNSNFSEADIDMLVHLAVQRLKY